MSEETREVARLLRSEKVTERKKGRKDCETLLIKDKSNVVIPTLLGPELLRGVLSYEDNEIKYARAKHKSIELDIVTFVRKVIRHFIFSSQRHVQVIVTTVDRDRIPCIGVIIAWVLEQVKEQRHELPYRDEHRNILCDLLDYRVAHSIANQSHLLYNILSYLQGAMVDKLSVTNKSHQRLLKQLCRSMFSDEEGVAVVVSNFVAWLCSSNGLFACVSDEAKAEADLAVTVADCCAVLIEYHGLNIAQLAFEHMKLPLQIVIRQLPLQYSRDSYRDPYVRFLHCFLNLTMQASTSLSCGITEDNPLIASSAGSRSATPLHGNGQSQKPQGSGQRNGSAAPPTHASVPCILTSLCAALANEDCLKYLVVSTTNITTLRQSSDSYYNPSDEPKIRMYFDVVAMALCLEHLHALRTSTAYVKNPAFLTQQIQETSNDLAGKGLGAGTTDGSTLSLLFARVAKFSLLASRSQKSDGRAELKTQPVLFEALLSVLTSLVRIYSHGEFLLTGVGFFAHSTCPAKRLDKLSLLVATLREKLEEALSLHNRQVIGSLLSALCELVRLTAALCTSVGNSAGGGGTADGATSLMGSGIRKEWSSVMTLLLRETHTCKYSSICKRASVSEYFTGLLNAMLEYDVLEHTNKWSILQRLWASLDFVRDPRLAESGTALNLLSNMIRSSGHEVPQAICQTLLSQLRAVREEAQTSNAADDMEVLTAGPGPIRTQGMTQALAIQLPAAIKKSVVVSLPLDDMRGVQQVLVYIVCWLEYQLDARVTSRVPLSCAKGVCDALDFLVQSVLSAPVGSGDGFRSRASGSSTGTCNPWNSSQAHAVSIPAADFHAVYSPLGGVGWFDNDHYTRSTKLSVDQSDGTSDEDILAYLGTNAVIDSGGRLRIDCAVTSDNRDPRSKKASTDEAKKDDRDFLAEMESSLRVLSTIRDVVLTADVIRSQCAEAGEQLAQWQLVCLFLCTVYASLAADAERKAVGRTAQCTDSLKTLLLFASSSFWSLVDVQIAVMKFRVVHQKWNFTADYLQQLACIVQRVSQVHTFSTKNQKGVYQEIASYRNALCDEMVDLLKIIRDSALVGSLGVDSEMGADDFDRDDQDGSSSPEKVPGIGANKRRRVDDITFDDDEEERGMQRASTSSGRISPAFYDQGESSIGNGTTCKLSFSSEKQRAFTACTVIFMIASFDHESVYDILPILQERQKSNVASRPQSAQLGRFGMNLDSLSKASLLKGHPAECKLWTSSEVMLGIASSLSSVYSINAVYYFFMAIGWDIDWGPLGYYKVLCIVYNLTSRASFLMTSTLDETHADILSKLVAIIFAQDPTLKNFPGLFWRVRFMQIKCMSNIMAIENKYKEEPGYLRLDKDQKNHIRRIFTFAVQQDPDIRVRLCAAARVADLLAFFSKPDAIYESLLDIPNLHKVASLSPEKQQWGDMDEKSTGAILYSHTDPLLAASNAVLIARMGVSSAALTQRSLLDLLRLCCSHIASRGCSTEEELHATMSSENDNGSYIMSLSTSTGLYPCFASLLYRLLAFMSRSLGYATPDLLLSEYSRWLLRCWVVETQWSLRSLPFQLFMPFSSHADMIEGSLQDKENVIELDMDSDSGAASYNLKCFRQFLRCYEWVVMPMLCMMEKQSRWKNVKQYVLDSGTNPTDSAIAGLLVKAVIPIYANLFMIRGHWNACRVSGKRTGTAGGGLGGTLYDELRELDEHIDSFLRNIVEEGNLKEVSYKYRSDLVRQMVCLYTFQAADEKDPFPQAPQILAGEDRPWIQGNAVFSGALQAVCRAIAPIPLTGIDILFTEIDLLHDCNVVEIMAKVHSRLLETRCARIQLAVLEVVLTFHDHLLLHLLSQDLAAYRAILQVLMTLARRPLDAAVLKAVCVAFKQVCKSFAQEMNKQQNGIDKAGFVQAGSNYNAILNELFCVSTCLLNALQACRISGNYAEYDEDDMETELSEHEMEVVQPAIADTSTGISAQDEFVLGWFSDLLLAGLTSGASTAKGGGLKRCVNQCINTMCRCVELLVSSSSPYNPDSQLDLAPLLPLPKAFVDSLSAFSASNAATARSYYSLQEDFAHALYARNTSGIDPDGTCGPRFISKIRSFVSDAGAAFRGESIPLPVIWLRLLNLTYHLEIELSDSERVLYFINEADGIEGIAKNRKHSLWHTDPDLIGTFVSCLVRLCSLRARVPMHALQDKVMAFLGHIGPPDLHSLSHTGMPARIGDPLVESGSNIFSLKARIFVQLCGMLWEEDPAAHSVASVALRELNESGCLMDVNLESLAPKIGRSCDSLLSAFAKIPMQARKKTESAAMSADPWDRSVWATENKTYHKWVSALTAHIIRSAYCDGGPMSHSSMRSPAKSSKRASKSDKTILDLSSGSHANFVIPLSEVCLLRYEIAEALLPLVLYDIVNQIEMVGSKVSGLLTRYLLSKTCQLMDATRLGCSILIFFLRQNINEFARKSRTQLLGNGKSDAQRSQAYKSQSAAESNGRIEIFSCTLTVDLMYAAEAANRCGCACTALLMAELSHEHSRGSLLRSDSGTNLAGKASGSGSTSSAVTQQSQNQNQPDQVNQNQNQEAAALLLQVFRTTHDPDALLGMLTEGSTLDVQAVVYAHRGSWVQALATYESLVQDKGITAYSAPHLGMAQALQGLGSQHVLTAYAAWCRDQGPHAGDSHLPEILGLASEGSWRNLDSTSHTGGSAGAATLGALSTSASAADSAMRKWGTLDTPSEAAGGGMRMVPDGYFNASIASALRDMDRGDCVSAIQRMHVCAAALLPNILTFRSHETACGMIRSLVRAQQLFEVREVCNVHREAGVTRNDENGLVNTLMQRWATRLDCAGGSFAASSESILSLRLSLVSQLLVSGLAKPSQALCLMDQVYSCIPERASSGSQAAAHALSPLAYKIKSTLYAASAASAATAAAANGGYSFVDDTSPNANAWQIQWALHECRLMWRKGLEKIAVSNLNYAVIKELRVLVESPIPASGSKRSPKHAHIASSKFLPMLSSALCQGGEWMGLRRAATGTDILAEYLVPAVEYAVDVKGRIAAYCSVAGFQDKLHAACKARVESDEHRQMTRVNADRKEEYERCMTLRNGMSKAERDADSKLRRHIGTLKKEIDMDSQELHTAETNVMRYLLAALRGYAQVLELSEGSDLDVVFRVISLWLKNREVPEVNSVMHDIIQNTRSYKFIPLTYQILSMIGTGAAIGSSFMEEQSISQMSKESSSSKASLSDSLGGPGAPSFSTLVKHLVRQMAIEHPYHVLPQLFALVNGDDYGPGSGVQVPRMTSRIEIAQQILESISKQPSWATTATKQARITDIRQLNLLRSASLVHSLEVLLRAYINLAILPVDQFTKANRTSGIKFVECQKKNQQFHRCLEVLHERGKHTGVITLTPPLQKNGDYSMIPVVFIQSIVPEFGITDSGLSRPKIIQIVASDGNTYKELVKSNDDMRQDAVMEQVFENVNITLALDAETRKRRLSMRTYKCVPMTPQTGVIQWVENARPFGDYLMHKETGAHARYYPHDWTHGECREYLKDATDNQDKEKRLLEIYAKFHPAFRFFFMEKYPDPAQWLSCRLAYTRSVAVASMLGYVLAIGDRHAQNIMLDVSTAEVVHIDFGIVFDQGKVLPTPETVPFRLTRDVIDGMGITGVEGTFKKSCEEVLRALRNNSAQILTILEVVIHDPLYKWSLSPIEARNKQDKKRGTTPAIAAAAAAITLTDEGTLMSTGRAEGATTSAGRDAAERTLMRIRNKLQGYEDSTGEGLGVEGQVEQLIANATDTKNLSRIYVGWAPWI